MLIKFMSLFYANSLLHVSSLLGNPQGDSQVVHYITAVDGCRIVVRILSILVPLCKCVYVRVCSWLVTCSIGRGAADVAWGLCQG
jgi:hypothetical protein